MTQAGSRNSSSVLWMGKPWILPSILARSIVIVVAAAVAVWLEFMLSVDYKTIANLPFPMLSSLPVISSWSILTWTVLVSFLVWVFSTVHLFLLRISNSYILHDDSLEVRSGILNSRAFVVSSTGFADLEVFRSIVGRILNSGDILIRTQSETDSIKKIERIRHPLIVADQIREVMARPIFRTEGSRAAEEKK